MATFKEECLGIIKEYVNTPSIIGYILLKGKMLDPFSLFLMLLEQNFDDDGIAYTLLGGMSEEQVRLFLEQEADWLPYRIDIAVTRVKNYYFYYSKGKRQ